MTATLTADLAVFSASLQAARDAAPGSPALLAPPDEPVLWKPRPPFKTERRLRLPVGSQAMTVWHVSEMALGRRLLSLRSKVGSPLSTQFRPKPLQEIGSRAGFLGALLGEHPNYRGFWMLDEPRLAPARELLMGPFRPSAVAELDALIVHTCREVLREHLGVEVGRLDVAACSNDALFRLMAYLLGAQPSTAPAMAAMFRRWMHRFNTSPSLASLHYQPDIYWRIARMIRKHDGRPGILADVQAAWRRGDFPLADLVGLVWALIAAGTDTPGTVASQTVWFTIAAGLWRPMNAGEAAPLVAESLRFYPPFTRPLARFTGFHEITPDALAEPGDWVELHLPAMNRDPEFFDHPDVFDPDRSDAHAARTFGGGAHRCIGNHYGTAVDAHIVATLSEHGLAPLADYPYARHAGLLHRLEALPLAFRVAH